MKNEPRPQTHEGEEVHRAILAELLTGIVGLFDAPRAANRAFDVLLRHGYTPGEIGIMIAEDTKRRFVRPSPLTHPAGLEEEDSAEARDQTSQAGGEGTPHGRQERHAMLVGAGAVSAMGALGGVLIAGTAMTIALPLGLLLLGPLAGLGAGFGALVGGVYAVPTLENEQADLIARYEAEVRAGKVLIHLQPRSPEDGIQIRREWDEIQSESA